MELRSFPNGIFGATTYLLYDKETLDCVMIDCTCQSDEIKKIIKENKLNLKYILITHGHFDHVYCLSKMKHDFPNCLIFMHKDDLPLLNQVSQQCSMAEVDEIKVPCIDGLIDENSKNIKLGNKEIKIIHAPGHSKGGVCYLIDNLLFSGDTLFKGSIGRCDLFGGDIKEIEKSIKNKIFTLDENITVFPGHGEKTSISYEKKYNPYFGLMA